MTKLPDSHFQLLKIELQKNYVPHLPALLDDRKPADQQEVKNLSRAFSAFALSHVCDIVPELACKFVVDDFNDKAVDAIYYHAATETIYIVQSKMKPSEQFGRDEALAFCNGVEKILRQDLDEFNAHVQSRKVEIEDAVEQCSCVKLVVAYVGEGVSVNAFSAFGDFFASEVEADERLVGPIVEFKPDDVSRALMKIKARERIDTTLKISHYSSVRSPKVTYFGLIPLRELVKLHKAHELGLYEKNIRTFLGQKTDVNTAIRQTLAEKPEDFFYLHNGVAALCQEINPKNSSRGAEKKIQIRGLSVINGAQTIASAAQYVDENPEADISTAKVLITLIKATGDIEFGKNVTKARNHQNSVSFSNFASLDDNQERLRRELAFINFNYIYKAGAYDNFVDASSFHITEAASALGLFGMDPRFSVLLKREPSIFLTISSDAYGAIFSNLTGQQLVNAVYFYRYLQERIKSEVKNGPSVERLIYRHGFFALGWVLAKRIVKQQSASTIIDFGKIQAALSQPFDELRQIFLEEAQRSIVQKGPLAFFKSQTDVVPLLTSVLTRYFGLVNDPVLPRKVQLPGQPYPVGLYQYILERAPQISI